MFGIGFFEFILISVIIIIFLGPDKLPEALMKVIKIFKTVSKSIHEAKSAIEEEINLEELKEDSKKYRALLEKKTDEIKNSFSFEDLKENASEVNAAIDELKIEKAQESKKDENAQKSVKTKAAK